MHALLIANGQLPAPVRYRAQQRAAQVILCADGGANRALAAGIIPHFVVGDFDSVTAATRATLERQGSEFVHRPSQYATDLEKSLQFALEQGCDAVTVLGTYGGRFDHQVCNLNILEKFSDRLQVEFIDDYGCGRFVRDAWEFAAPIGQQVSIFAFRRASGISTRGLKYPLDEATMEWAVNDGLSNEVVQSPVRIRVRQGTLLVYRVWRDAGQAGNSKKQIPNSK